MSRPASSGDNLAGMAMDFDRCLVDDVDADEDPRMVQNMDVQHHPGAQWLITSRREVAGKMPIRPALSFGLSQVSWRMSVAHHPTEDTQVRC